MKCVFLFAGLFFITGLVSAQKILVPQGDKSKVHFVIKNIGINTGGDLEGLTGKILMNENIPARSYADVTVKVETIDTDNERRDKHLRSADYFEVAKYSTIRIVSNSISKDMKGPGYLFTGTITIKDITKNISFPFMVLKNNDGYLFSGGFTINRLDFGVGGNSATLSDNVKVELSIFAR